jgi:hypothetical protein
MFLMPNGMQDDVQRWCQGIFDNIRGECSPGAVDPRFPSTNADNWGWKGCEEHITRELHDPFTGEIRHSKGVKFEVHWDWPWIEGEDQRDCFKSAIEKASCGGQRASMTFKNEGCYKTN